MKKLIPALCLLLISAMLMGTSTYAWFTMNKTVTATGMKVQARAEGGIVIGRTVKAAASNHVFTLAERKTLGVEETLVTPSEADKLLPTSTADGSVWYHSSAAASNAATSTGNYETLTDNSKWQNDVPTTSKSGYGYIDPSTDAGDELYYFVYDKLSVLPDAQSSSFEDLWISSCTVTTTAANSLSSSLRVAVVYDGGIVICAPVTGGSTTYKVGGSTTDTKAVQTSTTGTSPIQTLSAANTQGTKIKTGAGLTQVDVTVYVYFEGEDANHYTDNYTLALQTALDSLTIKLGFTCTSVAAGA